MSVCVCVLGCAGDGCELEEFKRVMCQGLGPASCPQHTLMDSEHLPHQSTTTPEQESHDKRGVKDTFCFPYHRLFILLHEDSQAFFSQHFFFFYLKAPNVLVSVMGSSYYLAGGHPA